MRAPPQPLSEPFPPTPTPTSTSASPPTLRPQVSYATLQGLKVWLRPDLAEDPKGKKKPEPKKEAGKKGGKGEPEAPAVDPRVQAAIDAELAASAGRELELLEARLVLVAERAQVALVRERERERERERGCHERRGEGLRGEG